MVTDSNLARRGNYFPSTKDSATCTVLDDLMVSPARSVSLLTVPGVADLAIELIVYVMIEGWLWSHGLSQAWLPGKVAVREWAVCSKCADVCD